MINQEQRELKGITLSGQSETSSLNFPQSEKNDKASSTILCFDYSSDLEMLFPLNISLFFPCIYIL